MNRTVCCVLTIAAGVCLLAGCASKGRLPSCIEIAPPDIHLTGEKTVIESQIVGDYREIEKNAWIISSVKTNVVAPGTIAKSSDPVLFREMSLRDSIKDDVRKHKDSGALGEDRNGLLSYRQTRRYEDDPGMKSKLSSLMDKENRARSAIFRRVLELSGIRNPSEEQVRSMGRHFAGEQRAMAKRNDWVQEDSGKWVQK